VQRRRDRGGGDERKEEGGRTGQTTECRSLDDDRATAYRHARGRPLHPTTTLRASLALASCTLALAAPAGARAETAVLLAAGDIASCTTEGDELTAQILDGQPGEIAVVGDASQTDGSAASFLDCYEPTWGRHKARSHPVPGNHEYRQPDAAPYFAYFGAAAGTPGEGWYSYEVGDWHVVALNSNCLFVGCGKDSPQVEWLRADLAAHASSCVLAYWHHPRFSSGRELQLEDLQPFWDALYAGGAEIVLSGHDHIYERFAPQTAIGDPSPAFGIREFIVGTGGFSHSGLWPALPNSEVRDREAFGILKLTLTASGYGWEFLSAAGSTLADSGSGTCHGPPPETTPPTGGLVFPAPDVKITGKQLLIADAYDNVAVARVDFLVDQTVVTSDHSHPYAFQWDSTGLPDGVRTLRARAVDTSGNATTWTRPVIVDNRLPDTTMIKGPPGLTRVVTSSFWFRSEPGSTFRCSLDAGPWTPCASPVTYDNLGSGVHVFRVRAKDAAGRRDPTPANHRWRVDARRPETKITLVRTAKGLRGRTTFEFKADEPATFECSLDDAAWKRCLAPRRIGRLDAGWHVFRVRATDRAGNTDFSPAAYRWRAGDPPEPHG
jgi:Bacterial Ig domain/Calcineurin-like phosphoesterase